MSSNIRAADDRRWTSLARIAGRLFGSLHDMALLQLVAGKAAGFRRGEAALLDRRQELLLARLHVSPRAFMSTSPLRAWAKKPSPGFSSSFT